jgi:DNA helicase-2/ATP-dependent DNA helicase PcrA
MNIDKKCPNCKRLLIEKSGRFGKFLACPGYPSCKHTEKIRYTPPVIIPCKIDLSDFKPSIYQSRIAQAVKNTRKNLVIRATAGSGKTRTLIYIISFLPESESVVVLSFNSAIARDMQGKLTRGESKTIHSLGLANIKSFNRSAKVVQGSDDKLKLIAKNYIEKFPQDLDHFKTILPTIFKIIHALKDTLMVPAGDSLKWLLDNSSTIPELNGDFDNILNAVTWIFNESIKSCDLIDFSDMIYFTAAGLIPSKKYDNILIDESQDLNPAQIEFIKKVSGDKGRIVAVGDDNQSIYAFRFADSEAMNKIISGFNADILPLSISYRNPLKHVAYINNRFPDIKHESSESAKDGILEESYNYHDMLKNADNGSLILCRNNAPLIKPCYALLAEGKKAIIKGREIGQGIINLIDKIKNNYKSDSLNQLLNDVELYREKESAKMLANNRTVQLESLNDSLDSIIAISDNTDSINGLIEKIAGIFSDDNIEGITLSSIHKAKGLESESVYWFKPELIPSKHAKTDRDIKQENNLAFVACSRSKNALYMVSSE